ncbi:proline--tRNA ligase [Crassaminicella thermophila]|uniref:Proline--tRNA ligase n=1 Tax=Crassaminicella thermophila TaxID=2599308 RepID=A0A5C0SB55_CRATE|nr:proline--tRNA ligase [Crassaminicella thermophila]QEK11142.1 proline--tRNA ligase [Crassaminicella thermophila]
MRMSRMYLHTLREVPSDAEIPSHKLLLRAGMIKKLVSGVYGYMPLGYRVIRKIEQIIREEMDKKGAQELLMSAVQPAELWKESGRWFDFGPEMFRLKDRHDREFCLGPTHEEVFTDIVRNDVKSYKELPLNIYQIQTKYRDEKRPRFGLMRSREFIMKDAYSFDRDWEGLDKSYWDMYDAYSKIFTRCGLKFRPVEADTGAMGGSDSYEFTALSDFGEGVIAYCDACDFAATTERAACLVDIPKQDLEEKELREIHTPNVKTIEELEGFLNVEGHRLLKTLLFKVKGKLVAAVIRGDRELNETKLINALKIPEHELEFATPEDIKEYTKAEVGFAGPVGLKNVMIVADEEVPKLKNLITGANKTDYHIENVNYGRDFEADIITDLKLIQEGDKCPKCQGPVKLARGIEVGQIFKLGTKYSEVFGAKYTDENVKEQPMVMGCYGIGVSRTMAAIIEQHHDENGIIWPLEVAPYHVIISVVNVKNEEQMKLGEKLYQELLNANVEVLLDDRPERAGVKFKDADLIGIPIRITVGKKASEGIVEYKLRSEEDKQEFMYDKAVSNVLEMLKKAGIK